MLKETFKEICVNYPINPSSVFTNIDLTGPQAIRTLANVPNNFKIYGGHGKGNLAQVPWIVVCDKAITDSARIGTNE